jgi:hypothetical protein
LLTGTLIYRLYLYIVATAKMVTTTPIVWRIQWSPARREKVRRSAIKREEIGEKMKGNSGSMRFLVVFVAAGIIAGCIGPLSEESGKDIIALEKYPGIYLTNDVTALPLATSGYDVYLIGETHGTWEMHYLFVEYLKVLHKTCELRDVILEVNQRADKEANAYALGESEEFSEELWNRPDRLDVLESIRVLNQELPKKDKIRVHLVDIDFPASGAYLHLAEIRERIGAENIDIPSLGKFETWDKDAMLEIVDPFEKSTDADTILNELETVKASIRYENAATTFDIREESIARNIQFILKGLDGAPVLALYGGYHAFKVHGKFSMGDPWAHRLAASGISVYSVAVVGISGQYWHDNPYPGVHTINAEDDWLWHEDVLLDENTTLKTLFDRWPGYDIIFVDLRENTSLRIPWQLSGKCVLSFETSLSEAQDGMVLFREISPSR